ncbi:hypothetical protein Ga0061062_1082 [Comamonas thiooxydans]|nr:hypothetical protein Ga0061062_1082 [Comamonas thiooxydans]
MRKARGGWLEWVEYYVASQSGEVMELQMTEVESHVFELNGEIFLIDTGRVESGWWWESPGFHNSEGTRPTRIGALEAAEREIQERVG